MARSQSERRLIAGLLAVLASGCAAPPLPPVPVPQAVPVQQRVLISIDMDDSVPICIDLTVLQRFEHPMLHSPICLETVGELRSRVVLERAAN